MKKIFASILALAMLLMLAACGDKASDPQQSQSSSASSSAAVEFPSVITVTVPFNAGSNTDNQIRFIQSYLEKQLGATIVVNNAGGASGVIGTTEFLTQKADGSNILFSLPTPTVYKPAGGETTYTADQLVPVAQITSSPFYLAVSAENTDFPDGAAVIDYIKNNPGSFTYANAGNGGIAHLAFASFLHGEGLDALSVPFTGGTGDEYTAVMGGHVMSYVVSETDLVGRSDIRPLINLGTKSETEGFADIPTLAELGYDGYVTDTFAGFYYMEDISDEFVKAFDEAVKATLEDPDFIAAAEKASFICSYMDSAAFGDKVSNTVELAAPVLQALK